MNRRRLFQAVGAGAAAPILNKIPDAESIASPKPTNLALVSEDEPVIWLPEEPVILPARLTGYVDGVEVRFDHDWRPAHFSDHRSVSLTRPEITQTITIQVKCYGSVSLATLTEIIRRDLDGKWLYVDSRGE